MAGTNQEQAFLEAILHNPGDDAARLIFADWLDEHGQPERADFIRRQIHLAAGRRPSAESLIPDVVKDGAVHLPWLAFSGLTVTAGPVTLRFSRGFLGGIDLPLDWWKQWGPTLVREHPLTEVRIADKRPYHWSEWRRESRERFTGRPQPDGFDWLSSDPRGTDGHVRENRLTAWINDSLPPRGIDEVYPTEKAAHAALSEGCLRWAKGKRRSPRKK